MKPLIVMVHPMQEMTGGTLTYTEHLAKIFNSKYEIVHPLEDSSKYDNYDNDCTIISAVIHSGENIEYMHHLPKPIFVVVHEIVHFPDIGTDIHKMIDGYIAVEEETKQFVEAEIDGAHVLTLRQPYVPTLRGDIPALLDNKKNKVLSAGRIVPERGHRHAAELTRLGYDVTIAGSRVDHHEYGLYYERVERYGAKMETNITNERLFELFKEAKVLMSFYYVREETPSVHYVLLEAMNFGCVPVVPEWYWRSCTQKGLQTIKAECSNDASFSVDRIFNDDLMYRAMAMHNMSQVDQWSGNFVKDLESFVDELR